MGKIKNWKKVVELPKRVVWQNDSSKNTVLVVYDDWSIRPWSVNMDIKGSYKIRKLYHDTRGSVTAPLRSYKTKKEAMDYAVKYMRRNPQGEY